MIQTTLYHVAADIWEVMGYLPVCAAAGTAVWLLGEWLEKKKYPHRRLQPRERVIRLIWILYLTQTAIITFFSREPGSRSGIDWRPFETWGTSPKSHALVIENILLFVPFGILLPLTSKKFDAALPCVRMGIAFSCGIELLQLMTQRGYCQADDVITNGLGTWIGFLALQKIRQKTDRV